MVYSIYLCHYGGTAATVDYMANVGVCFMFVCMKEFWKCLFLTMTKLGRVQNKAFELFLGSVM
jgi:hypothetical protein